MNDSKDFIEYSNDMHDIYKNIKGYNLNKERNELIEFHDVIADMLSNEKLNPIVIELTVKIENGRFLLFLLHSLILLYQNVLG